MSKTIDCVPESITRERYDALIRVTGFDPAELRSLRFTAEGIYAEAFAKDRDGHWFADGDEVATHEVFIPVVDA